MTNLTPFSMKLSNKLILGSGSPRRKQLLEEAGFQFEVRTIDYDESFSASMKTSEVAEFLARNKNMEQRKTLTNEIVLTADTVVVHEGKILGKPVSNAEAISTISSLSGQVHQVVTGVCISDATKSISFSATTEVKFKELTSSEIEFYVHGFQPMDKAGSYAIQEWIGLVGVQWIKGSFYNVVGLPISEVYHTLKENF